MLQISATYILGTSVKVHIHVLELFLENVVKLKLEISVCSTRRLRELWEGS
jgi:hypothetical protein